MKVNIYYGGRGLVGDPTVFVLERMTEIFDELHVKVDRYNLHEHKRQITALPGTIKDADAIILASTVEWYGIGGYMHQFLDACWLYGDKEKIHKTYMFPIVMSTTYGEREGLHTLSMAWDTLGGPLCSGLCGYIEDFASFELNKEYIHYIEKQAENLYRTISQKAVVFPTSSYTMKQSVNAAAPLKLTPQETEQLSKYVSDEEYVRTQKEDIRELATHFKSMLGNEGESNEDRILAAFRKSFVPQKNLEASYKMIIEGIKNAVIMRIKDDTLAIEYGNIDNPSVLCKMKQDILDEIMSSRMTFQRAFMSGVMQVKGDFKLLRMLDEIFVFSK